MTISTEHDRKYLAIKHQSIGTKQWAFSSFGVDQVRNKVLFQFIENTVHATFCQARLLLNQHGFNRQFTFCDRGWKIKTQTA